LERAALPDKVHGARQPLVELHNATVVLGATRVLNDLTLTICAGEHTAILGPNGAGKSTLMKLLALEQYPLSGEHESAIRLFGRERWDVFELRSQLGMVSSDLHDRFTRGNNCGAITAHDAVVSGFFASQGLFNHHHVSEAMRQAARDALEIMGVAHLADSALDSMSTGEARRVLIARALAHKPRALVLDEPTRGLDLVARHHFMERVRGIASAGTTILLVTHHVDEIIPEIGRVILLQDGRIAGDGPKSTILTDDLLSRVFRAPLVVDQRNGYYNVHHA
jgi:iron complex transport system ATP-binding protein